MVVPVVPMPPSVVVTALGSFPVVVIVLSIPSVGFEPGLGV